MKRISSIALFVAATLSITGLALGQDHRVSATVPFNFSVNNSTLPAGNYAIGSDVTTPDILSLNDRDAKVHVMAMGRPESGNQEQTGKLVFHKYRNQYFLSEIRYAGSTTKIHFTESKAEKRAKSQTEEAGLPVSTNVLIALN